MELIPIKQTLEENEEFVNHPDCSETIYFSVEYYKKIGFYAPWIGYYAKHENQYVGMAGFKGQPKDSKVEIAYGVFERYKNLGIGTEICRQLVQIVSQTDSSIIITARTLPEKNHSTRILEKNAFGYIGTVIDEEDGEVWEWQYKVGQALNKV